MHTVAYMDRREMKRRRRKVQVETLWERAKSETGN
jgi:hypothetical protein